MFFDIVDAVTSCLDREAARKLVKLNLEEEFARNMQEFHEKARQQGLDPDDQMKELIDTCGMHFFWALQQKARGILGRPRGSKE